MFNAWTASRTTSMTRGRVKPRRHASPIRRPGTGLAISIAINRLLSCFKVSALAGKTVMPSPEATICLIVSREFPCQPSVSDRLSSGQLFRTCCRKQ